MLIGLALIVAAGARADFLSDVAGSGARPMGMGLAFVAVTDDANNIFFNPGGLALSDKFQATSMMGNLKQNVDYRLAGGSLPSPYGALGVGYITLSSPVSELILSCAKEIAGTLAGANFKLINRGQAGGSSFGLDLGALMRINNDLTFGANFQNVLSTAPSLLKFGLAQKFADNRVLIAADADYLFADKNPVVLHGGIEIKPVGFATFRAGLNQSFNNSRSLTTGLGMNLENFNFDYAYHVDQNTGAATAHYFSISFSADLLNSMQVQAQTDQREFGIISRELTSYPSYRANKNDYDILKYYQ